MDSIPPKILGANFRTVDNFTADLEGSARQLRIMPKVADAARAIARRRCPMASPRASLSTAHAENKM